MSGRRSVVIPIPSRDLTDSVVVEGSWPISEQDWACLTNVLAEMRLGLVGERVVYPLCRRGHEQSPENMYGKDGRRRCRLCNREDQWRFDDRKYGHRRPHRGMGGAA